MIYDLYIRDPKDFFTSKLLRTDKHFEQSVYKITKLTHKNH